MAHEKKKLAEARYFYSLMHQELNDREKFTFNLSAFLSSARSVLQYVLEEAKNKKGGQQWYDNHITGNSVLSFFKDKRDLNIHFEPINPIQYTDLVVHDTVHIQESVMVVLNGNNKILNPSPPEVPKPQPETTETEPLAVGKTYYRFSDWQGREDIFALSEKYLDELEGVIQEGVGNGFFDWSIRPRKEMSPNSFSRFMVWRDFYCYCLREQWPGSVNYKISNGQMWI